MRCGFLGHVVAELLLDASLMLRHPGKLDLYYERLAAADPTAVEQAVNQMARGQTERLRWLIPLFLTERFLYDYAVDATLLARLNAVLQRVKLTPLPDAAEAVLASARRLVDQRLGDLLPSRFYPSRLLG
jgi:hypothetical protein